ncbi:class I SAM-dependent methyltransferase [Gemmata sp. JC717]|uniref:class I SAM-dependent methyltransferase n=1 Tax=Gemmata algarum TaxID=2975278 RepID=UPI0021BB3674|nr:class I SAM-dependent methyltransferase [Gemmata algarum]MDY3553772.1 class I SAM-dependent methyltransferase [Gemmata algarum]
MRIKARDKFADAALMYFTREALEQSTSEIVGRHRARRFAEFGNVADLCCGVGADAIALARTGLTVNAVDLDPLRVAMCVANAAALGVTDRVRGVAGDAIAVPLPDAKSAFADPDRRASGRRFLDPEDYAPSLGAIRGRFGADFPLGVKIAPGVAKSDIPGAAEAEFVSLSGELKECVLWFGPLRQVARRATVLPSGETLTGEGESALPPLAERVGSVLYDPDPAVTRAGLIAQLAERLSAEATDFEVQLLTAGTHTPTAFATAYRVEHTAPFHPKHLRDYLRVRQVGRVTIINRGSPADPAEVVKKLKLDGPGHRGVLLTRVRGSHTAVVCERLG